MESLVRMRVKESSLLSKKLLVDEFLYQSKHVPILSGSKF